MAPGMDNATPPYAYVVDYRPLDACAPPNCRIKGRSASGLAKDIQPDGDPGAYVSAGTGTESELYYRRGIVLRPHETYELTLPPSTSASEFDAYLWATLGSRSWRANVSFSVIQPGGGPGAPESHDFEGKTAAYAKPTAAVEGEAGRYVKHVRVPIPSRAGRLVRVTIENTGSEKLSVGTPVVMRKVEGRGPRQIVFALFDAVPFHEMDVVLHGDTGEPQTAWLQKAVSESGLYFPDAVSPAQATVSFFSRFLTGELWPGRGWPGMFGNNAIDESMPEQLHGPLARLGEDGFLTELVGDNFTLAPNMTLSGFDGAYQLESKTHATGIERYVVTWAEDHPHDDAMLLLWNAQTHAPYATGTRAVSPTPLPPNLATSELNRGPAEGVWRNLLDGIDHLKVELEALRRAAPSANRIVWIGADHSRGITNKMKNRAFRAVRGFGFDLSHGSANTIEEMRTPYALLFDGPPRPAVDPVVSGTTSTLGVWRVVESRFGLDLELTPSTMFDHPLFAGARPASPWVDRIFVGAGIAGSFRVVSPSRHLAYGLFSPTRTGGTLWALPATQQRVMLGAPTRSGFVVDEELYDDSADPYELNDIASARFDDVLQLRRELVDFVATHYDPPDHPRNVYTLQLPERMQLRLTSFGKLRVLVDGEAVQSSDPHTLEVTASKIEIVESEDPLGVVEVTALDRKMPLLLRCAANSLMLDQMSDERTSLNLALARTNCPLPATGREVTRPGEILFTVRKAQRFEMGSSTSTLPVAGGSSQGGVGDDLLAGMKRWGYVRDIDENKP